MNKELNWLQRLSSPTPKFFKKVIYIFVTLTGIGASLQALPKETLELYPIISTISTHLIAIGSIVSIIAKSAVDFDRLEKNDTGKN